MSTSTMTTLDGAHKHDAHYFGDRPDWLIVLSRTRDSDCLEQSNFESALGALGGEGEHVAIERSSHWAVGWIEYLVIDPSQAPLVTQAEEMRNALENYPVLDEEDYSRREYEEYLESWDNWGRGDYRRALRSRIVDVDNDSNFESARERELKEACDDLTDEQIDELVEKARQSVDWEYQSEGSGVTINISGLAESTDIDKVIALCADIVAENRRVADIKRLAFHLGACPAQANEAVALNIRLVSGLQALMQGSI